MALAGCTEEHCDDVLLRLVGMSPEYEEALQLFRGAACVEASTDTNAESTGKMSRDVTDSYSAPSRAQESQGLQPRAGVGGRGRNRITDA
jgi:hypothetical protein